MQSSTNVGQQRAEEFIDLARSANVMFEIVGDRLTMTAVNPNWKMWAPIRHFLDEIGQAEIEACVRARTSTH